MKVFVHYCPQGFSNCYMLGIECENNKREALLVDPGCMDEVILNFIENQKYNLKGILVTHDHINHIRGIRSIMRIYKTEIYAAQHKILEHTTHIVRDGDSIAIGNFHVDVISVPGHSADSVIYKTEHFLFTGDVISAGMMGSTPSPYSAMQEIAAVQNKIFSTHEKHIIFPGHGPPSTVEIEKGNNIDSGRYLENRRKTERRWHNIALL
jgi:glyoxylase-like metal-dependent hydrolase (beta-lactamase superfamily II)